MNEEQRKKYLESGGSKCPYCESENISAGDSNTDADYHSVRVDCENCEKTWYDIYTLTGVEAG